MRGWVEAMTSIGRLIFFDQPGTGASDPIAPGASPTLEQWTDSITAVLDELGSREAVLLAFDGTVATGALFAATHPTRTKASGPDNHEAVVGLALSQHEDAPVRVLGDSAYGTGATRAALAAAGHVAVIKPLPQRTRCPAASPATTSRSTSMPAP